MSEQSTKQELTGKDIVVKEIETAYPEMTKEFKKILKEQYEIWCHKMADYGTSNIALGTNLEKEDDVKASTMGIWFRMNDKINRLKNMVVLGKSNAVEETVEDNFKDISIYAIIAQVVKNGKWGK